VTSLFGAIMPAHTINRSARRHDSGIWEGEKGEEKSAVQRDYFTMAKSSWDEQMDNVVTWVLGSMIISLQIGAVAAVIYLAVKFVKWAWMH
jgi:hypothetical protein